MRHVAPKGEVAQVAQIYGKARGDKKYYIPIVIIITPWVKAKLPRGAELRVRVCRVFDDRQRAVAAPSCNGRRVGDVLRHATWQI